MFVAVRDLRFAKGRFALMGTVVVLITLLVVLLSGLTAGLGRDSTSAISDLPADHLTFSAPVDGQGISFVSSSVDRTLLQRWEGVPGVTRAEPLGIATAKASAGPRTAALAAFGVTAGSRLAPDPIADGRVVLSTGAADALEVRRGQTVTLGGQRLTVDAIAGDASYSHTPVIWTSLADWQRLTSGGSRTPGPDDGGRVDAAGSATVIALTTTKQADLAAADRRLGTVTVTRSDALRAISSYTSENASLQLMRGLLFAISALVIGAFFTVWTIQRSGDVAVLKALGATTGYLLRDALGQAIVLLTLGTAIGTGLAAAIGTVASRVVPFALSANTILVPAGVMIVLGAIGAALSIRRITAVDPLTALGSAR